MLNKTTTEKTHAEQKNNPKYPDVDENLAIQEIDEWQEQNFPHLTEILQDTTRRKIFEQKIIPVSVENKITKKKEEEKKHPFTYAIQKFQENKDPTVLHLMLECNMDCYLEDPDTGNCPTKLLRLSIEDAKKLGFYADWSDEELQNIEKLKEKLPLHMYETSTIEAQDTTSSKEIEQTESVEELKQVFKNIIEELIKPFMLKGNEKLPIILDVIQKKILLTIVNEMIQEKQNSKEDDPVIKQLNIIIKPLLLTEQEILAVPQSEIEEKKLAQVLKTALQDLVKIMITELKGTAVLKKLLLVIPEKFLSSEANNELHRKAKKPVKKALRLKTS